MPRIKVERILSISSEDNLHPAENILTTETNKKWKCKNPGEKSCMVILQLPELYKISGIDIGNEHSAFVEVLVGRTGFKDEEFKQFLLTSSFMTPRGSAQSDNPNRTRMFVTNDFCENIRDERWDRIKFVCTQPFNKHVQYGLSFVTLHSSTAIASERAATSSPVTKIGNFAIRPDEDVTDKISAGSVFNKLKLITNPTNSPTTGKQNIKVFEENLSDCSDLDPDYKPDSSDDDEAAHEIRKASLPTYISQNGSPSINKLDLNNSKTGRSSNSRQKSPKRNRNSLLYDEEDDLPSKKVDRAINNFENSKKKLQPNDVDSPSTSNKKRKSVDSDEEVIPEQKLKRKIKKPITDESEDEVVVEKKPKTLQSKPFKQLLEGVVFVMSGYQNPLRADIRNKALAMGAKYKPDWVNGPGGCTHLICAFRNTPKYQDVAGFGKIMTAQWITDCYDRKKRLSWRRYALDREDKDVTDSEEEIIASESLPPKINSPSTSTKIKTPPSTSTKATPENNYVLSDSGEDTEDEIEKIQQKTKRVKDLKDKADNCLISTENKENEAEVKDNPIKKHKVVDIYDQDTDLEDNYENVEEIKIKPLPRFFDNKQFLLSDKLDDTEINLLKRYICAYAGSITQNETDANFIIAKEFVKSEAETDTTVVHPAWIWECHDSESLVPVSKFVITRDRNNGSDDEYD